MSPPDPTRELHVAALPFPSPQGTQAAIRAYCEARLGAGHLPELLTYGARGPRPQLSFPTHRPRFAPPVGLRSGPSPAKLLADAALATSLRRLAGRFDYVVAHHVEAALASLATRTPSLFLAHTTLGAELPAYLPTWLEPEISDELVFLARDSGDGLDRFLARRCWRVAALSPRLAGALEKLSGRSVSYVPLPWPPMALRKARRPATSGPVTWLYAGNLDAYQGWEDAVAVLPRLPETRLLVLTSSDAAPLRAEARRLGVSSRVTIESGAGEEVRRRAYDGVVAALIPRRMEGGVPVKLLDAMARGVPAVVAARGTGDLPLGDAALRCGDDDVEAFAAGAKRVLTDTGLATHLRQAGPKYISEHHSFERASAALDAALVGSPEEGDSRR